MSDEVVAANSNHLACQKARPLYKLYYDRLSNVSFSLICATPLIYEYL